MGAALEYAVHRHLGTIIPSATDRIRDLQNTGKTVMVVSNAAGYPKRPLLEICARLGFDFAPADVLTSREDLPANLANRPPANTDLGRIVMAGDTLQTDILGGAAARLKTALITEFAALKCMDTPDAIRRSGIILDYTMPQP